MTVKEIAHSAATVVQADDLMAVFSPYDETPAPPVGEDADEDTTAERDELDVATMIKSVNMAAAELSHDFPALVTERASAEKGIIPFSAFAVTPVSVRRVERGGRAVSFTTGAGLVRVEYDGEYDVTYAAAYAGADEDGEIELGAEADSQIMTYLTARNYCLITGRTDEAGIWDQRYIEEKQNRRMLRRARIPARKFV